MNFRDVEKIIKIFEDSNVDMMELEVEGFKIKLDKRDKECKNISFPMPQPMPNLNCDKKEKDTPIVKDNKEYVTSPLVGTFYSRPSVDSKPFVNIGQSVKKGQKLCIIEAMKVMNEIVAQRDGVIKEILVKDGQIVEFGHKLFVIE